MRSIYVSTGYGRPRSSVCVQHRMHEEDWTPIGSKVELSVMDSPMRSFSDDLNVLIGKTNIKDNQASREYNIRVWGDSHDDVKGRTNRVYSIVSDRFNITSFDRGDVIENYLIPESVVVEEVQDINTLSPTAMGEYYVDIKVKAKDFTKSQNYHFRTKTSRAWTVHDDDSTVRTHHTYNIANHGDRFEYPVVCFYSDGPGDVRIDGFSTLTFNGPINITWDLRSMEMYQDGERVTSPLGMTVPPDRMGLKAGESKELRVYAGRGKGISIEVDVWYNRSRTKEII